MAILLTGGTGRTSGRIARYLKDANIPFLLASRSAPSAAPPGMPAVKFDYLDSSTYEYPFQHKFPKGESISAIYLMSSMIENPQVPLNAFIDYARKEHGVKRFVLCAGSSIEPDKPGIGKVWKHFLETRVEYCVLRPTWFMENFLDPAERSGIKGQNKLFTACGNGRIPWVSVDDIAAVGFHALTAEKPPNCDYRILGPELLTYDQVAAKFSSGLGREIKHVRQTEEERAKSMVNSGLPEHLAKFLAYTEKNTSAGSEDRMNDVVEKITGRPPKNLDTFIQENKAAWL